MKKEIMKTEMMERNKKDLLQREEEEEEVEEMKEEAPTEQLKVQPPNATKQVSQ